METKEDQEMTVMNQSSLQLLEEYSSDDEVQFHIRKEESETEDGEVKDPAPNTSTPTDLAKSLEKEKLRARELARKKLELSPPKNKVCTVLNNPGSDLEPVSRPKRSCAINSYLADNYVLPSTKIISKPVVAKEYRSKSHLVAPKITTFLKPKVALSEVVEAGSKNEETLTLPKPKVVSTKSQKLIQDFFPKNA